MSCPECGSANSRFDCFCGTCGTALARLQWLDPQGEWRSGNGRLPVTESGSVEVSLANDGVVPVALILRDGGHEGLPSWLDASSLRERVIRLEPGGSFETLELPVSRREPDGTTQENDPQAELEAELLFLTSLASRVFHLRLVLARKPWLRPVASLYRFIPIERLQGEGLEHVVELHNEAAAPAELSAITIDDDDVVAPAGYARVGGHEVIRIGDDLPPVLKEGKTWEHHLRLRAENLALPEDQMGWFSATLRYELTIDGKSQPVTSRLVGVLGRGPTLVLEGPDNHHLANADSDSRASFTVVNPGQLPVEVTSIEVLRQLDRQEEPAPSPDWLVLEGLKPGDTLAAGEQRALEVRLRPTERPTDELEQAESTRQIRIRHDGWQEPSARHLGCEVTAAFGRAEVRTLGIDFGTTNSVACLMGEMQGHPLVLELLADGRRFDSMASLMYFDQDRGGADEECFLFGEAARGSAGSLRPSSCAASSASSLKAHTAYIAFGERGPTARNTE
ncbi:MAG: hypothetical protein HC897_04640 [Thermoanaerobaculia bacterium]|nr:hypothetical protein [Thermoanaerobaculia bacterium]